jgi:hypothetical protein
MEWVVGEDSVKQRHNMQLPEELKSIKRVTEYIYIVRKARSLIT